MPTILPRTMNSSRDLVVRNQRMDESLNPYASPAQEKPHAPSTLLDREQLDFTHAIVTAGQMTRDDFVQAQRVHRRGLRAVGHLLIVLLLLTAGGGVRLLVEQSFLIAAYMLAGAAIYLTVALFLLPRLAAASAWRYAASLREPHQRRITADVIQTITPTSNIILRWTMYFQFRRTDDLMLLYLREQARMFTLFPRHTFQSDDDWEKFVAMVEANLERR